MRGRRRHRYDVRVGVGPRPCLFLALLPTNGRAATTPHQRYGAVRLDLRGISPGWQQTRRRSLQGASPAFSCFIAPHPFAVPKFSGNPRMGGGASAAARGVPVRVRAPGVPLASVGAPPRGGEPRRSARSFPGSGPSSPHPMLQPNSSPTAMGGVGAVRRHRDGPRCWTLASPGPYAAQGRPVSSPSLPSPAPGSTEHVWRSWFPRLHTGAECSRTQPEEPPGCCGISVYPWPRPRPPSARTRPEVRDRDRPPAHRAHHIGVWSDPDAKRRPPRSRVRTTRYCGLRPSHPRDDELFPGARASTQPLQVPIRPGQPDAVTPRG